MNLLLSTGNPTLDYIIAGISITTIITIASIEYEQAYRQHLSLLEWIDKYPIKVFCLCIIILAVCFTLAYSQFGGGMAYTSKTAVNAVIPRGAP